MNELQRYLVDEAVEDYEEGRLTRRKALKAIAGVTGAMLAAQILEAHAQGAPTAKAPSGSAPLVAPDDPSIVAGVAEFPGVGARLAGYLARPAKPGSFPIVLVCHENRGLTRHIEDVARRVAKAGYVGLAVDLLSREGGTAKHGFDAIPGILGKAAPARHVQDFQSGLAYARSQPSARRRGGPRDLRGARRPRQPEHSGDRVGDAKARQDFPQDRLSERQPRLSQRHGRPLQRRGGEGRMGRSARVVWEVPSLALPTTTEAGGGLLNCRSRCA